MSESIGTPENSESGENGRDCLFVGWTIDEHKLQQHDLYEVKSAVINFRWEFKSKDLVQEVVEKNGQTSTGLDETRCLKNENFIAFDHALGDRPST